MEKFKIPKSGVFNTFGIVKTISGTYVCPGWHEVPEGTPREQIELIECISTPKIKKTLEEPKTLPKKLTEWKIPSSNGKKMYIIKNTPFWNCTCPANQFRRGDCKHIKKIKDDLKQNIQTGV